MLIFLIWIISILNFILFSNFTIWNFKSCEEEITKLPIPLVSFPQHECNFKRVTQPTQRSICLAFSHKRMHSHYTLGVSPVSRPWCVKCSSWELHHAIHFVAHTCLFRIFKFWAVNKNKNVHRGKTSITIWMEAKVFHSHVSEWAYARLFPCSATLRRHDHAGRINSPARRASINIHFPGTLTPMVLDNELDSFRRRRAAREKFLAWLQARARRFVPSSAFYFYSMCVCADNECNRFLYKCATYHQAPTT